MCSQSRSKGGRRALATLGLILALFALCPAAVLADVGPKPSLTIYCRGLPASQTVYIDLLIDDPIDNASFAIDDGEAAYYDPVMFEAIKNYSEGGWRPALVTGTSAPLWGSLERKTEPDGSASANFNYFGVPSRFKVIVATENGEIIVSNLVETKNYQSTVIFDCATGQANEQSRLMANGAMLAVQFAGTFAATMLIEGLLLLAFRFSLRLNWKPFLFINLGTQLALYALITLASTTFGVGIGVLVYFLAEGLILLVETVLFIFLLKQHSKLRRGLYAATANILSFVAGFAIALAVTGLASTV